MDLQAVLPVSSISTWRLVKTWARAGPYQSWRWRLGPARFGSYDDASIATAQAACHAPASEAVTAVTGYSPSTHRFYYPLINAVDPWAGPAWESTPKTRCFFAPMNSS